MWLHARVNGNTVDGDRKIYDMWMDVDVTGPPLPMKSDMPATYRVPEYEVVGKVVEDSDQGLAVELCQPVSNKTPQIAMRIVDADGRRRRIIYVSATEEAHVQRQKLTEYVNSQPAAGPSPMCGSQMTTASRIVIPGGRVVCMTCYRSRDFYA